MTQDAFRALLSRLDLSQVGAAKLLRVEDRTVRRWCSGDAPIPFTAWALLSMLDRGLITESEIEGL